MTGILTTLKQVDMLVEEIAAQRAENEALRKDMADLRAEVQRLAGDLAPTADRVEVLARTVEQIQDAVAEEKKSVGTALRHGREADDREREERERLQGSIQKLAARFGRHVEEMEKVAVGLLERFEAGRAGRAAGREL